MVRGEQDRHATSEDSEEDINVAAVAAYRASIDTGKPLSERKLAAMFGKTSRRWPVTGWLISPRCVASAAADTRAGFKRSSQR